LFQRLIQRRHEFGNHDGLGQITEGARHHAASGNLLWQADEQDRREVSGMENRTVCLS
jgi:hypothetical protein